MRGHSAAHRAACSDRPPPSANERGSRDHAAPATETAGRSSIRVAGTHRVLFQGQPVLGIVVRGYPRTPPHAGIPVCTRLSWRDNMLAATCRLRRPQTSAGFLTAHGHFSAHASSAKPASHSESSRPPRARASLSCWFHRRAMSFALTGEQVGGWSADHTAENGLGREHRPRNCP